MNLKRLFFIMLFAMSCMGRSPIYSMDLVKICPKFKTTYIRAYQSIESKQCTNEMTYLYNGLTYGSSLLYYNAIEIGIDDCIKALGKNTTSENQEIIRILQEFKNQIKSDEVYNPQTSTTYRRIPLRSGKAKFVKVPYQEHRCYKISVDTQNQLTEDEEEF